MKGLNNLVSAISLMVFGFMIALLCGTDGVAIYVVGRLGCGTRFASFSWR